jgi:hypothetical protein
MEPNIQGPITTADSKRNERLVVDAGGVKNKKRKSLIERVKQQSLSPEN